ncbi:adult-specific cuticular protein ACP-22-like [Cochliomyia hominivorax]
MLNYRKCIYLVLVLLGVSGWTVAGSLPYYHHNIGHATSYAVVTKHVEKPHHVQGWIGDHYADHHEHNYDFHKYPKYEFDYGVKDLKTGDIKNQWEHRDGDHVKGSYSLKEADGTTRIVEYSADDHNGFNAVVKKIGHARHPEVYAKPAHYVGDYGHHVAHDVGYDHGHASSYVKVNQY